VFENWIWFVRFIWKLWVVYSSPRFPSRPFGRGRQPALGYYGLIQAKIRPANCGHRFCGVISSYWKRQFAVKAVHDASVSFHGDEFVEIQNDAGDTGPCRLLDSIDSGDRFTSHSLG
jgi:hypothetical protein